MIGGDLKANRVRRRGRNRACYCLVNERRLDTDANDDTAAYFFFSTCRVRLRSRGLYFCSFSFSPPGLRRIV